MVDPITEVTSRLANLLDGAGVAWERTRHDPVYTSAEAAAVRGTSLHSGAKALIIKGGEAYVLVVIPADLALDSGALRKYLGSKHMRFATKEELMQLTGLTPGSVPPFGSLFNLPTICDERLAESDRINFNAGSHCESVQMDYRDYVRVEAPRLASISKPAG